MVALVERRIVQAGQQSTAHFGTRSREIDMAATQSIARNRRFQRSEELLEMVRTLDTATDPRMLEAAMERIEEEYEERQVGRIIGLFSRCYLGAPYVDHRLDMMGTMIIEHYTRAESPPPPYGMARPMARSDSYLYVEVYDDGSVIPVRPDGRAVL